MLQGPRMDRRRAPGEDRAEVGADDPEEDAEDLDLGPRTVSWWFGAFTARGEEWGSGHFSGDPATYPFRSC